MDARVVPRPPVLSPPVLWAQAGASLLLDWLEIARPVMLEGGELSPMCSLARMSWLTLTLLIAAATGSAQSAQPTLNSPLWESLFNGVDLSGWRTVGNEKWVVENGTIYGQGVTEDYGYLVTEKDYKDFHLSLRFKCEAGGNSGVYVHTKFKAGTAQIVGGRQIEIDRTLNHHTGGIYGDDKGWIVWPAPHLESVIRPNDWNEMLIQVEGRRYIVHLNGIELLDFTHPSPGSADGPIALQLHSGGQGRMRFKDIFIRDLSRR